MVDIQHTDTFAIRDAEYPAVPNVLPCETVESYSDYIDRLITRATGSAALNAVVVTEEIHSAHE